MTEKDPNNIIFGEAKDPNNIIFSEAVVRFIRFGPRNPFLSLVALVLRKLHLLSPDSDGKIDVSASVLAAHNERLTKIMEVLVREDESIGERENTDTTQNCDALSDFALSLVSLDDRWFDKNFGVLFDDLMQRCFSRLRFDIFTQPASLTRLVGTLIGEDVKTLYNPFAGVASYALVMPRGARYVGEEIDPRVAAIGNLRIMAYGIDGEVLAKDSFDNDVDKADIIVSTTPLVFRINSTAADKPKPHTAAAFLLEKCAEAATRGIIVAEESLASETACREIRQRLIECNMLESVIFLPGGIFLHAGAKTVVFVINPDNRHKGSVKLINARGCFTDISIFVRKLDVAEIETLLHEENDQAITVSAQRLRENDYALEPSLYSPHKIDIPPGARLMKMSQLGTFKSSRPVETKVEGRLLTNKYNDIAPPTKIYRPSDFPLEPLSRPMTRICGKGIVFNRMLVNRFSFMCVDTEEETLYSRRNVVFFVPDESVILLRYLAIQLTQPYVKKRIEESSLPLRRQLDENTMIIVPPLTEQRNVIEEYQAETAAKMGLILSNERDSRFEQMSREFRLRRHTLLNSMHGLVTGMSLIKSFIDRQQEPFEKTAIVAARKQLTLQDMIDRMNSALGRVVSLVDDMQGDDSFGTPRKINLSDFCNEYAKKCLDDGHYDIVWPNNNDVNENLVEREKINVNFSDSDLSTVFENIITNARKHGFRTETPDDGQRENHLIRVEYEPLIDEDGNEKVMLRFLNNGLPLPEGVASGILFEWGKASGNTFGTGLGGWHIKNIVEHYGGSVRASNLENDERGFTVMYEIILPTAN